ncbi:hypothetical protein [Agromyces lapidis]|uniref:Uncharacterized protein n=1 Tax=Agromyces lapidis TaxID=279574 RepID=A0ABV5SVS2_9MICO|nr:hypothetical protein [Agromyces lapidis]
MTPDPKRDAAVREIDAHARYLRGGWWWTGWVGAAVIGVIAAGAVVALGEGGWPLGLVGFLTFVVAAVLMWFELQHAARVRAAERVAPAAAVMPFVVPARLRDQLDAAGEAVGHRAPYVPNQGYGLLVADTSGIRVLSGWAFSTAVAIPRSAIEGVELGTIEYPLGTAQSVDLLITSESRPIRVSFRPLTMPTRYFGEERPEIIARYVEALRDASSVPSRAD